MTTNNKERRERILDVAVELAEKGGFDNVRQRDVAAQAGVALGTLYKSFRSKEDLLVAALEREAGILEQRVIDEPLRGKTTIGRLTSFFAMGTEALCEKPNFARAVLRAMASGEPEVAGTVAAYYGRLSRMVVGVLRNKPPIADGEVATEEEATLSFLLLQVWFAALVGWSAGLTNQDGIGEQISLAARLLLRGLAAEAAPPPPAPPSPAPKKTARSRRPIDNHRTK